MTAEDMAHYYPSMVTLALDTTTRVASSALAVDGDVAGERVSESPGGHGEQLPRLLMMVLDEAGVALAEVDLFAVATGPGSFTGLRIGIATMQGLAFSGGKPLAGVSALDALAAISSGEGIPVVTWVDAWRGEVYAARYEHGQEVESPTVESPQELLGRMTREATLFIGDGAATYRDLIRASLGPQARVAEPAAPALAGTIARVAAAAAGRGERMSPHAVHPLYVRRTDAELARDARATR